MCVKNFVIRNFDIRNLVPVPRNRICISYANPSNLYAISMRTQKLKIDYCTDLENKNIICISWIETVPFKNVNILVYSVPDP